MQSNVSNAADMNSFLFRPYRPSKILLSFLLCGSVFFALLAIDGILYGIQINRNDTLVFSVLLLLFSLFPFFLVCILWARSHISVYVTLTGITIKQGTKTVVPETPWTHFHKAYYLCDYRKRLYLVLADRELQVGIRKELLLKLADNIPKVITNNCITLCLESHTAEEIERLINGTIPIEKYMHP